MLFNWKEMYSAAIESCVVLLIAQKTGVYLVLIQYAFILVPHNTEKLVVHGCFSKTIHKIVLF